MVDYSIQQQNQKKIFVEKGMFLLFLSCVQELDNSPGAISLIGDEGRIRWIERLTMILVREDSLRGARESRFPEAP